MTVFKVYQVDSWSDGEGGWTANSLYPTSWTVSIRENDSDEVILNAFRDAVDEQFDKSLVTVDSHEFDIYIDDAKTGEQLFHLIAQD